MMSRVQWPESHTVPDQIRIEYLVISPVEEELEIKIEEVAECRVLLCPPLSIIRKVR